MALGLKALLHRRVRRAARRCHHALLVAPMGLRFLLQDSSSAGCRPVPARLDALSPKASSHFIASLGVGVSPSVAYPLQASPEPTRLMEGCTQWHRFPARLCRPGRRVLCAAEEWDRSPSLPFRSLASSEPCELAEASAHGLLSRGAGPLHPGSPPKLRIRSTRPQRARSPIGSHAEAHEPRLLFHCDSTAAGCRSNLSGHRRPPAPPK